MTFIYSAGYAPNFGRHVFPVDKYRLLYERLLEYGIPPVAFHEPQPASWDDIALVHTPEYIDDLLHARRTERTMRSELPVNKHIIDFFTLTAGGTVLAAELALNHGWAGNLSGGFHHAFPEHAEGFCYINDIAVAIRAMQRSGKITAAAVIDCDLHQGNGTAVIFHNDPSVFTYSIHQFLQYPTKEKSDQDVHLEDFTLDEEYNAHLRNDVPRILEQQQPELVMYLAGADPYFDDLLGGLELTIDGLAERDVIVLSECWKRNIPVVITLAGGYARNVNDVVTIHANTFIAAMKLFQSEPDSSR